MRPIYAFVAIMLSVVGHHASAKDIVLKRHMPGTEKMGNVEVTSFNGIHISKNCIKNGTPNCLAWKATSSKTQPKVKSNIPLLGHPASKLCQAKMGTSLIFIDEFGVEVDYCQFRDNSAVNSWDLYNAINDKK